MSYGSERLSSYFHWLGLFFAQSSLLPLLPNPLSSFALLVDNV